MLCLTLPGRLIRGFTGSRNDMPETPAFYLF